MARVNAEEFATKHANRLKNALPEIQTGIERVKVSPTAEAAKKQDKMLANLTKSVQDGKWKRGLESVSKEEWQEKTITKGLQRIGPGIDAAHSKQVKFATKLLPAVDAAAAKVKLMDDRTIEDSVARASTFIREMAKFSK